MPTQNAVLERKRLYAESNSPDSFGTMVATPEDCLQGIWDVFGSSERIATRHERHAALLLAAKEAGLSGFPPEDIVPALLRFADAALGFCDASTSCLWQCIQRYERILADKGFIDPGKAWSALSAVRVFDAPVQVDATAVDLTPSQRRFFSSQNFALLDEFHAMQGFSFGESVRVRALCPAGRYAEPSIIEQVLLSHTDAGQIVVAARSPLSLYEMLAEKLAVRGFSCSVRDFVPFSETHFGRAVRLVRKLSEARGLDCAAAASDFLFNPFSGLAPARAQEIDAFIRSDRAMSQEAVRNVLRVFARDFEYFEELVEQPDSFLMLDYFKDRASALPALDGACAQREQAAIELFGHAMRAAWDFGLDMSSCLSLTNALGVPDTRAVGDESCCVRFMRHEDAACMAPGSADVLLACDMTAEEFFPPDQENIASEALRVSELSDACPASERAWKAFALMSAVPSIAFYAERRLKDEDGAPLRPSVVLEALSFDEGDVSQGEECVLSRLAWGQAAQECLPANRFQLSQEAKSFLGSCASWTSAAQIERYLSCPYAWFAECKLRPKKIDEGFGASEQGAFGHAVLRRFYECFQDAGFRKVREGSMDAALDVMDEVISEHLEEQWYADPSKGRFVPLTESELKRVDETADSLKRYLRMEAQLLPSFAPSYFEYEIPRVPEAVYAGFSVMGTIDRIDVDAQGRAVIVDYKTSVPKGSVYRAPSGELLDVRGTKIQTLVYAQVVRRVLGLDVVGALYVGYGGHARVAGAAEAFASCVASGADIDVDVLTPASCGYENFSAYLDAVEGQVSVALQGMRVADIAPNPANKDACRHCSGPECPERRDA